MALGQILAGGLILADDLQDEIDNLAGYAIPVQVIKANTTNRASTITPTADPELVITLAANQTHLVRLDVFGSSAANAAGDLRVRFAWTNTATVTWWLSGLSDAIASGTAADLQAIGATSDSTSPTADTQFGLSTSTTGQTMYAYVATGGSAVVLSLEWAQLASNASNSSVLAGSRLSATRIA